MKYINCSHTKQFLLHCVILLHIILLQFQPEGKKGLIMSFTDPIELICPPEVHQQEIPSVVIKCSVSNDVWGFSNVICYVVADAPGSSLHLHTAHVFRRHPLPGLHGDPDCIVSYRGLSALREWNSFIVIQYNKIDWQS